MSVPGDGKCAACDSWARRGQLTCARCWKLASRAAKRDVQNAWTRYSDGSASLAELRAAQDDLVADVRARVGDTS